MSAGGALLLRTRGPFPPQVITPRPLSGPYLPAVLRTDDTYQPWHPNVLEQELHATPVQ